MVTGRGVIAFVRVRRRRGWSLCQSRRTLLSTAALTMGPRSGSSACVLDWRRREESDPIEGPLGCGQELSDLPGYHSRGEPVDVE